MHLEHWGLTRSPFANQLDPSDFYPSAAHEEALARFEFMIANGRRLGLLYGPSGTGKSLLLEVAARQLRRSGCHVVKINAVGLSGDEFIWKLSGGLGHHVPPNSPSVECWRGISDQLIANRYQRVKTVIMLDDAEEAPVELEAAICRLALIDPHPDTRLTLMLAGRRHRTTRYSAKLNDLCELRIDLEPWDLDETNRYVEFALEQAGASQAIFDHGAIEHLYDLSHGIPRRIRQLAELCLLAGAAEQLELVTDTVVESVFRALAQDGITEAA